MIRIIYVRLLLLFFAIILSNKNASAQSSIQIFPVKTDSLNLFDKVRNRSVPIALYLPITDRKIRKQKLVIFSHGYYQNMPSGNKQASYLTENLAAHGYFIASIQHELPSDELIPTTGIPQIVRRPFWDRGADNILFVINELKKAFPDLDFKTITLVGHSNGGDMTALFPQKYPGIVSKIITLDNRRMPLPRTIKPKVYSIRSSDQSADEGVLPSPEEQTKLAITIIKLPATIHNDMDNRGTKVQQKEINDYVLRFLKE
ncbi:alpha/beta hydrolase family protein [Dyadobacter frigoris]|uniref:Alpha/beta hydrolase n=1 Tax=Dyadobacter frigoris TaxID=2576211 RepID=A0A4U6D4Q9_9BACT|nr:alpha/beta hydrolase [Dyadobacter frigoris]TKT92300.1 alpha/beta hydrolase [Dyadobacter frigoris]GLU53485.1 esterase [Dyadobacter frigoris]